MTDYRSLSGAEFQREVGDDPDKWADAFAQRAAAMSELISDGLRDELAIWFRNAMEVGRQRSIREVIGERKQLDEQLAALTREHAERLRQATPIREVIDDRSS